MFKTIARKIFGSENDRFLKMCRPFVARTNELEAETAKLTRGDMVSRCNDIKQRLMNGEPIDHVIPEVFAMVREAGKRTLNMRHYDVQLIGGMVLHKGKIAEMKTGEGKTLVATLALVLNALSGKGCHLVTVNDYLAQRDAEWMGNIYKYLGLTVGVVLHGLSNKEKKDNYNCDITYGTNSEFGFDYLRDNMKYDLANYVQRDLHFGIVDEVDSILIDEARTPLIISGPSEDSTELYTVVNSIMYGLRDEVHFKRDEKAKSVVLNEDGVHKVEQLLKIQNLYAPENLQLVHHVQQALKAHFMFAKEVDYILRDNRVMIVDEFTGRIMEGRRWSDGLHQAIEAKEGVKVESENQTLATITYQNYFRMYKKLAGMTGTADTEAAEFADIYNLGVIVIPTNRPTIRTDHGDVIFKTRRSKEQEVIKEIQKRHEAGQPVLVGTISVDSSEVFRQLLEKARIPHNVLNAKFHHKEADIIAQAGRKGAVTIATNMAGRGTDIVLGGNPEKLAKAELNGWLAGREGTTEEELKTKFDELVEKYRPICIRERDEVVAAGGLHIVGTERHESRRIDNQLRGRSGRQGDPGSSRFFLSLEDDLLRIFGGEKVFNIMDKLGLEEGQPIEHRWITKAIENAQKKVEGHNFSIRKHVLEYDDVMNQQRKAVYALRRDILTGGEKNRETVLSMIEEVTNSLVGSSIPEGQSPGAWDCEAVREQLARVVMIPPETFTFVTPDVALNVERGKDPRTALAQVIYDFMVEQYTKKMSQYTPELTFELERHVILEVLDFFWRRHLLTMDHLREGIGLRGYGQKNPKLEYKREGFSLFTEMMSTIYSESIKRLFAVQIVTQESLEKFEKKEEKREREMQAGSGPKTAVAKEPAKRIAPKVNRNDPCPCGSGQKFKKCCMDKGIYD
ncbi:MAG TPA: preprotein translocase subunit SecA [bacterium]|nr:preprotein translocase subunit SecA [bacterium]